jgi:hypothetical protein
MHREAIEANCCKNEQIYWQAKIEFSHRYVRRNGMTKLHFNNRNVVHNFCLTPQFMITQLELLDILKDTIDLSVLYREFLLSKTKRIVIPRRKEIPYSKEKEN